MEDHARSIDPFGDTTETKALPADAFDAFPEPDRAFFEGAAVTRSIPTDSVGLGHSPAAGLYIPGEGVVLDKAVTPVEGVSRAPLAGARSAPSGPFPLVPPAPFFLMTTSLVLQLMEPFGLRDHVEGFLTSLGVDFEYSAAKAKFKCFYFTHSSYVHFNVRLYSKGCDGGECVVEAQRRKGSVASFGRVWVGLKASLQSLMGDSKGTATPPRVTSTFMGLSPPPMIFDLAPPSPLRKASADDVAALSEEDAAEDVKELCSGLASEFSDVQQAAVLQLSSLVAILTPASFSNVIPAVVGVMRSEMCSPVSRCAGAEILAAAAAVNPAALTETEGCLRLLVGLAARASIPPHLRPAQRAALRALAVAAAASASVRSVIDEPARAAAGSALSISQDSRVIVLAKQLLSALEV